MNPDPDSAHGLYHEAVGIGFTGIATWRDPLQGSVGGPNTVFVFDLDGVRVCHLGDLGHSLSDQQVAAIGEVHVLCVPVGGFFTIDASIANKIVKQLKPNIILPMHYKYNGIQLPIAPISDFLCFYPQAEESNLVTLNRNSVPPSSRVVMLKVT